ncbi:succinyl-diaminopimelate desuccinylase [Myxococcota bacterium]|nr:succinyl-diaminopimelate desuccinylase [Myxococcota bacterium]
MTAPDGAAIDLAERLARDALELVRIESETGREGPICDRIEARLRAVERLRVRRHSHSLLADLPPRGGTRPVVMLLGHLDTVPTYADTRVERRGGRIHGAGASDMKGALAVMLALAEDLGEAADPPHHVAFAFYEREEGPIAANGLLPLLDACGGCLPRVDLGIALEPTDGRIHLGCVGSLHATVVFHGRKAHAARPWQGDNAIAKAGTFLTRLHDLGPRDVEVGGLTYREVMTITQAVGGGGRNVVPDRFEVNVNARFAPGRTADETLARLRELAGEGAEVVVTDLAPPGPVCVDNPHYQRFRVVSGAEVQAKQAWTDVAQLGARGIDAINYGPGLTSQAHQVGEYVEEAALATAHGALWRFLAGAPSPAGPP